jgi:hypothetical protein
MPLCSLTHSLTHSAIAPNYIILLKTNEKRNPNIKPIKKEKKNIYSTKQFLSNTHSSPTYSSFHVWTELEQVKPPGMLMSLSLLPFLFLFFYKKTRISIGLGMERSLGQNKIF